MQPFFVSRKGEIPPGCEATYEMAVFHEVEDDRTGEKNIVGIYDRSFIDAAQTIEGTPKLTSLQIEALDYLDALCVKLQIEMRLQSGDIQWLHNHTTFHARSAFKTESELPRHLLRLWLSPENGIKLPNAFKTRSLLKDGVQQRWHSNRRCENSVLIRTVEEKNHVLK